MNPAGATSLWLMCAGWAVAHFFWQACLVAGALALANRLLSRSTARARYLCGWLALGLCMLLPVISFSRFLAHANAAEGSVATLVPAAPLFTAGPLTFRWVNGVVPMVGISMNEAQVRVAAVVFPMLAALWVAGSGVLLLRFRRGWSVWVRSADHAQSAPSAVCGILEEVAAVMRCAVPGCKASHLLESPVVMGVARPVVVVPMDFEERFPEAEQRALLAHELAHIQRGDPWRNALQCVLESLVFWHPAAVWVSRCVRHEREMAADEVAAGAAGGSLPLAHALHRLAEETVPPSRVALAANRGSLWLRVRALVGIHTAPPRWQPWRLAFVLATMPLCLLAAFHAHVASGRTPWAMPAAKPPPSKDRGGMFQAETR